VQQRYFLSLGDSGFHRIAYTDWGDPTCPHVVVCVHGLARNSRDFDFLADELTPECRVMCMDVAGRGESDWLENKNEYTFATYQRDAAAMLARTGATAVDWVGTSMGGLIGMFLTARPHSPIRRLVLNDVGALVPWAALFRMKGYITRGRRFSDLADSLGVPFAIVDCTASPGTLRERILRRSGTRIDPSEANLAVLDHQMRSASPLGPGEREACITCDTESKDAGAQAAERLLTVLAQKSKEEPCVTSTSSTATPTASAPCTS